MPGVECERCGFEWTVKSVRRRALLCASCRAQRVQTVHTDSGKCIPWSGHYAADEITPVDDDGSPVLPGVRSCGHTDCVYVGHVIGYGKDRE
jgi:hypothetical protein